MDKNMDLWQKVQDTPKGIVITEKHDDGTEYKTVPSINRIKKATEVFGIYGKKWGLKNIEHNHIGVHNGLHIGTIKAVFFVAYGDDNIEFEINNSTAIAMSNKAGATYNPNYIKSLETDTICKALSRLGFNADIYSDGELIKTANEQSFKADDLVDMKEEKDDRQS